MFALLVLRNMFRHKLRTTLTVVGIVVAITAFGLLRTIVEAWYAGADATSSTERCSPSIRPCSETAKSTRSDLPSPSSASWRERTRCSWMSRTAARRSATRPTAAAAIAIQPAAEELRCTAAGYWPDERLNRTW